MTDAEPRAFRLTREGICFGCGTELVPNGRGSDCCPDEECTVGTVIPPGWGAEIDGSALVDPS